jgi:predicted ester cyclase
VSTDDNKAVVRKMFASTDAHDFDTIENDLFAPEYQLRFDSMPQMNRSSAAGFFRAFVGAFPDISHTLEDVIAEGDRVGARLTVRGTNTAEFMGMPPSNKPISIAAINMFRLKGGRIVDQQINSDGVGMLMQLGVIPGPDQQQEAAD